jgi:hypothetical protein
MGRVIAEFVSLLMGFAEIALTTNRLNAVRSCKSLL